MVPRCVWPSLCWRGTESVPGMVTWAAGRLNRKPRVWQAAGGPGLTTRCLHTLVCICVCEMQCAHHCAHLLLARPHCARRVLVRANLMAMRSPTPGCTRREGGSMTICSSPFGGQAHGWRNATTFLVAQIQHIPGVDAQGRQRTVVSAADVGRVAGGRFRAQVDIPYSSTNCELGQGPAALCLRFPFEEMGDRKPTDQVLRMQSTERTTSREAIYT